MMTTFAAPARLGHDGRGDSPRIHRRRLSRCRDHLRHSVALPSCASFFRPAEDRGHNEIACPSISLEASRSQLLSRGIACRCSGAARYYFNQNSCDTSQPLSRLHHVLSRESMIAIYTNAKGQPDADPADIECDESRSWRRIVCVFTIAPLKARRKPAS